METITTAEAKKILKGKGLKIVSVRYYYVTDQNGNQVGDSISGGLCREDIDAILEEYTNE